MKKEFKSESKKLLELMIHSIYSNKDIFLRELLSNASDAIDKREFYKAQGKSSDFKPEIKIEIVKEKNQIVILDNGIGMNEQELDNNLGTIAHSGSGEFVKELENSDSVDVIGQFGVGFYSSFIVAENVEVITKKENEEALCWKSDGVDSYEISKADSQEIGTKIILTLKNGEDYSKYLDQTTVENLVKEHSNYVKYPILLLKEITDSETDTKTVDYVQINEQKALWKQDPKEITDETYKNFYMSNYMQFDEPSKIIHKKIEGITNNNLLLFIPSEKSFNYNSPQFNQGIDLYSKGILIEKNVEYLIPKYFNFVKGLVDSEDLELNISREMLQKDAKVRKIQDLIENTVRKELEKLLKKDSDTYIKFYESFGRTIKFGVYDEFGANSEKLKNLLMFKSNKDNSYITLKEYIERNEKQNSIYYIAGTSIEAIKAMPIMETVEQKNLEVIYLLEDIDEFAIQVLNEYESKKFESILTADIQSEDEKKELEEKENTYSDTLNKLKDYLKDDVADIKLTDKLSSSFSTIRNQEDISIEQEKILAQNPDNDIKLNKVLELNPNHEMWDKLIKSNYQNDLIKLIYMQTRIQEGLEIENPKEFNELVYKLIK